MRGGLVEEGARRGLDADCGLSPDGPVGDGVEVLVEDPELALVPGVLVLEVLGKLDLADLPRQRAPSVAQVEVAHELLRDRRAALHGPAGGDVGDRGPEDALEVDALVMEEALVLDRDRGVLHVLGDVLERHRSAKLVGLDEAQALAVGGEDLRRRALVDRLERFQRRRAGRDVEHVADRHEHGDEQHGAADPEAYEDDSRGAALLPAPATLSLQAGHGWSIRMRARRSERGSKRVHSGTRR